MLGQRQKTLFCTRKWRRFSAFQTQTEQVLSIWNNGYFSFSNNATAAENSEILHQTNSWERLLKNSVQSVPFVLQYQFCSMEEQLNSSGGRVEHGNKERSMDEMRKHYIKEKIYKSVEVYAYYWWRLIKTNDSEKQVRRHSYLFKRQLQEEQLFASNEKISSIGFVQNDIQVPEYKRTVKILKNDYRIRTVKTSRSCWIFQIDWTWHKGAFKCKL